MYELQILLHNSTSQYILTEDILERFMIKKYLMDYM